MPTEDEDELRAKCLFPLLVTNLGQVVAALARVGACNEGRLWEMVGRACRGGLAVALGAARGRAGLRVHPGHAGDVGEITGDQGQHARRQEGDRSRGGRDGDSQDQRPGEAQVPDPTAHGLPSCL